MIRSRELVYSYTAERVINFPDIQAERGSHWLLLGQSGSGKTTLLHLLGGLLKTQRGTITVQDTNIASLGETQLDHFRGQHMGFIFQRNHLLSSLSVEDNLLMAPYLAGLPQDRSRVKHVLSRLGLSEFRTSRIQNMSLGQVQRVAIARAIMNKPVVLLADEPTSALDDVHCHQVMTLLREVAEENNSTILIATHDQRLKSLIGNQILL